MAYPGAVTNEVDPVSRIEGHLGIALNVSGGVVQEAHAHGNLWRGFENFLIGREPNDAITFTQRICGVCPVPHGMTATYAADTVLGYSKGHITFAQGTGTGAAADSFGVPPKAVVIRNLVLGAEYLMSSITHFYHLAAPSYVQGPAIPPWTPYFNTNQYVGALKSGGRAIPTRGADGTYSADLWSTVIRSYVRALRIRRLTFEAGALFAGRMPMTSCYVAGGVTYQGSEDLSPRIAKFRTLMTEVGLFVIQEYIPIVLALGALYPGWDNTTNAAVAPVTGFTGGFGAGVGRFLAWGAFPQTDAAGTLGAPGGFFDTAATGNNFQAFNKLDVYNKFLASSGIASVKANLTEDIAYSRYQIASGDAGVYGGTSGTAAYPGDVSRTSPKRANGYTYMKAPRWHGMSAEVGPLARLVVAGLYPVDGSTAFYNPAGNALQQFYAKYATTDAPTSGVGLDPKMVYPDIAVAVVRSGLATLVSSVDNGTSVVSVSAGSGALTSGGPFGGYTVGIDALTVGQINTAYSFANPAGTAIKQAYITGGLTNWIVGLVGGLSTIDRLRGRAFESGVMVQNIMGAYSKSGGPGWTITSGSFNLSSGGPGQSTRVASFAGSFASNGWLDDSSLGSTGANSTWRSIVYNTDAQGWGANEAPRGALMHQCTIAAGKISKYQCIVPTTWNGSPKDANFDPSASAAVKKQHRGPIEQSCVGVTFASGTTTYNASQGAGYNNSTPSGTFNAANGGVELVRCAQSFDPCIACAVH